MGIVGASVDPHDKMRAKDITKVAKGEQAVHPVHDGPLVSKAPPPSATDPHPKKKDDKVREKEKGKEGVVPSDDKPFSELKRDCLIRYYEYHRCIQENKGGDVSNCEKFADFFRAECPKEWIQHWDEERKLSTFPSPL